MSVAFPSLDNDTQKDLIRMLCFAIDKIGGYLEISDEDIVGQMDPKVFVHYDSTNNSWVISSHFDDSKKKIVADLKEWGTQITI